MDRSPGRRTLSPSGAWEFTVAPGGDLSIRRLDPPDPDARQVDRLVDPRLAISPAEDLLVYARQGPLRETDLWLLRLPDGDPEPLTAWTGNEDRPVFSPDGTALAFVSGHTGIASWWRLDLGLPGPVEVQDAVQLSNVDLHKRPRQYGEPPPDFLPVPDGPEYAWTDQGLQWTSRGRALQLPVPR